MSHNYDTWHPDGTWEARNAPGIIRVPLIVDSQSIRATEVGRGDRRREDDKGLEAAAGGRQ